VLTSGKEFSTEIDSNCERGTVKLDKALIGAAGVNFVAAELSRRGYIALPTIRNTRGIDLLVSSPTSSKALKIQVKTKADGRVPLEWFVSTNADKDFSDDFFYVFVNLIDQDSSPDYYVLPSKTVAEYVKRTHTAWLAMPGKGGKKHSVDNKVRRFPNVLEKFDLQAYSRKWNLLA
jgi:hypothetical protein